MTQIFFGNLEISVYVFIHRPTFHKCLYLIVILPSEALSSQIHSSYHPDKMNATEEERNNVSINDELQVQEVFFRIFDHFNKLHTLFNSITDFAV